MCKEATILDRVRRVVVERLKVKEEVVVTEKSALGSDLGADSLDVTEFMMGLEDEFVIQIPDEDITDQSATAKRLEILGVETKEKDITVGFLVGYIGKRLAE